MKSDDKLFISLYQKYKTPVYHYAFSILKDEGLAQDVMQETFIRVRSHEHEYKSYKNVRVWILRIAHNLSLNCIRDRSREFCEEEIEIVSHENAERQIEESDYINSVLRNLKEDERICFTLHYLYNYKYKEIAEITDTPMGTVQTRCKAARQKLMRVLGGV